MLSKLIKWWNRPAWVSIVVKGLEPSKLLQYKSLTLYKSLGLCGAVLTNMPRDKKVSLFRSWPKFSGDNVFPVPGYLYDEYVLLDAHIAFDKAADLGTMYDTTTEYGRNRLELAEFIRQALIKEYY